ncbi:MAG: exopolysaccharide biosynthesis polyprenyl glycosylphosphotransferase [Planctomycetota bacterium]|nr:exopolysaccharide biosynthesis polyprenyl glycosylphosphotransferase [Planctomycetota bacterium]
MSNMAAQTTIRCRFRPAGVAQMFPTAVPTDEAVKRVLEVLLSATLLVIVMPVMVVLGLAVRATSPGPVFFRQRRLGRGGREFWCYNFRTMGADAEAQLRQRCDLQAQFAANFKIRDDPRVTRLGAVLRKTRLDELPQLWNVLMGDLSVIGPRPIVPHELEKYGPDAQTLLSVKPGLGGIW